MKKTRREFIAGAAQTIAVAGLVAAAPGTAHACLYGQWWVRCPACGQVDLVEEGNVSAHLFEGQAHAGVQWQQSHSRVSQRPSKRRGHRQVDEILEVH